MIDLVFKNKEELISYGENSLYNAFSNFINFKEIEDRFVVKTNCPLDNELYDLLGVKDFETFKNSLNYKPVSTLKTYLKTFVSNIFKELDLRNSFISNCFYDDNGDRKLEIKMELKNLEVIGRNKQFKGYDRSLHFSIMSMQKDYSCGRGHSFSIDLINIDMWNYIKNKVNELYASDSLKQKYFDYFESQNEANMNIESANENLVSCLVDTINDYLEKSDDDLTVYSSLKELKLDEMIAEMLKEDFFFKDISEYVNFDFEEENILIVKFLGKEVKKISKISHMVYEIK